MTDERETRDPENDTEAATGSAPERAAMPAPSARKAPAKRSGRQRVTLGARLVLGAATSVGAVLAVTAAAALPWPAVSSAPPSLEVTPAPAEIVLSCDGPLLALGRDAQNAQSLTVARGGTITSGNDRGETLSSDAVAQPAVEGDAAAERFLQRPDGDTPISAAASSSVSVDDADLAGFSASACRPPQMESWIVGGDTETGTTGILLLANPGDVDATVQITLYGVNGAVTPPGAEAVAIPPRTQVAMPLAGLAGGEPKPVLRITATGAPVRASLQSSIVRTLDPGGVDVQAAVRPAATQVIPGLRIIGGAATTEGAATIARLMSEQEANVTITISEVGSGGAPARDPEPVALAPGSPLDVDLGGLEEGEYTVTIGSDSPVVAAVWQTTGFGKDADFAWHTAAPDLTQPTLFAVPKGPEAALSIANPATADVTVTLTRQGEEPEDVEIPAGDAKIVPVDTDALYTIDPGAAVVHAAVGFATPSALASFALWPDAARPLPVVVYP